MYFENIYDNLASFYRNLDTNSCCSFLNHTNSQSWQNSRYIAVTRLCSHRLKYFNNSNVKFRLTRFVLKCVNVSIICDNYRYFTLHTLPLQTILWLFLHCKAIYDNEKTHQCIKVVISTANTTRFDNPSNTFEGIWVGRFCSRNRRHRTHEVCLSIRR